MFQKAIKQATTTPHKLFLIDGLGALLSIFLLGVVLVKLERFFGIPIPTLYLLAFIPCFFVAYDFYCFLTVKQNIPFYLKGIALMNSSYCLLSIILAIYHYQKLSYLAWGYIITEITIVMALVYIELQTAKTLSVKK
ncbi:hypothetical protein [Aureispira anguillae]|uniref:Uncharacterized protein n=1 Tax=Aureispira anguillae TaxID=2864201 RepID=A0A915YCU8_9BACT|nr:hypothetical protein [Aureispira anguillae]BDS10725.1 hypothetical protein AsAng_0014340 [Aureispira anguillae]